MNTNEDVSTPASSNQSSLSKLVTSLVVARMLSIGLNVLLGRRVRVLVRARSARVEGQLLTVGLVVRPINAKRLGGQQEVISYETIKRPTILYAFSPRCVWCARNMENFKALVNGPIGGIAFNAEAGEAQTQR